MQYVFHSRCKFLYEQINEKKSGIVGSGNGIRRNEALVKIFEEKFGFKMKIPVHLEEAAAGAAMFAMIADGDFKSVSEVENLITYIVK